jgi:hypothetical protein
MTTIYPDVEQVLVARISDALNQSAEPVADGVVVSVKKPAANVKPYPSKIVTIRADGGVDEQRNVVRREALGINVYAQDYATANDLVRLVEAIVRGLAGGQIKLVEVDLSWVRVDNPAEEEQRFFQVSIVTQSLEL